MDAHRLRRLQTVDDLLSGYGSLSVPQLMKCLTPDFRHQVLPASLDMIPHDKEAFAKQAAGIFAIFDEFAMVPCTVSGGADASGPIMVHAQMRGRLKGGRGPWTNECVIMIRLTDDATQVREVVEFVDSAKAMEMARSHAPKDFALKSRPAEGKKGGLTVDAARSQRHRGDDALLAHPGGAVPWARSPLGSPVGF
ncbi:hypothetical protein GGR56DRAFT_654575 [Xylariaceae sp. FL0804]|nr:hypothetical protein GGR56DRAFT_654575 [Xylariaceae sp. FL0804]